MVDRSLAKKSAGDHGSLYSSSTDPAEVAVDTAAEEGLGCIRHLEDRSHRMAAAAMVEVGTRCCRTEVEEEHRSHRCMVVVVKVCRTRCNKVSRRVIIIDPRTLTVQAAGIAAVEGSCRTGARGEGIGCCGSSGLGSKTCQVGLLMICVVVW